MLEHVAPNQTRFVAPGLAPDARGVAVGRFLAVLLPAIDRVVGLFRGLSAGSSLDEMLPSLKIFQVRTPLQSREFLVLVPVTSSYAADQIAAVVALVGGLSFSGSAKHFVRYRDSRSPLGYDVDSLYGGEGDFVLYAGEFVQAYVRERELSFDQLVFSLSLQRAADDELQHGDAVLLRAVPGLWRHVLGYLHRNNVPCAGAASESTPADGPGAGASPAQRIFLLRCPQLPARMAALFQATPGVEVHRMKLDGVAVQLGYRHPIELASCATIFDERRFYLFSGDRGSLEIFDERPPFVESASLVSLVGGDEGPRVQALRPLEAEHVRLPLRLVPFAAARPPLVASRVPCAQAAWLKKLVYVLPPQVLGAYSICITDEYLYLLNESGIDYIPLGEMFYAVAPGVMVPVGFQLIPRVHPAVLLQQLDATGDQVFFFRPEAEAPVRLQRASFTALARQALAQIPVEQPLARPPVSGAAASRHIVNEPLGMFPLWGFSAQTTAGDEDDHHE